MTTKNINKKALPQLQGDLRRFAWQAKQGDALVFVLGHTLKAYWLYKILPRFVKPDNTILCKKRNKLCNNRYKNFIKEDKIYGI